MFREAAEKAFKTVWGEKVPGHARGKCLMDLALLIEEHADVIASIESLGSSQLKLTRIALMGPHQTMARPTPSLAASMSPRPPLAFAVSLRIQDSRKHS